MRGTPTNDTKLGEHSQLWDRDVRRQKGALVELISCLRNARSNWREIISFFKYPIHVFIHFCPTISPPRQTLERLRLVEVLRYGSRAGRSIMTAGGGFPPCFPPPVEVLGGGGAAPARRRGGCGYVPRSGMLSTGSGSGSVAVGKCEFCEP